MPISLEYGPTIDAGGPGGKKKEEKKTTTSQSSAKPSTPTAPSSAPSAPRSTTGPSAPSTTSTGKSTTSGTVGATAPSTTTPSAPSSAPKAPSSAPSAPSSSQTTSGSNLNLIGLTNPLFNSVGLTNPLFPLGYWNQLVANSVANAPKMAPPGVSTEVPQQTQVQPQPEQAPSQQQPQMFSLEDVASMIEQAVSAAVRSVSSARESRAESQALVVSWMNKMMAQITQLETQVIERLQQMGSSEDPSIRAAFDLLRTQFDRRRQELLEDLAARGLVQSGIMAEIELRLNENLLSEQERLLASRLSEIESQIMNAITSFANQRMNVMMWGAQTGVAVDQAALDRIFQAQQNQINTLLNAAGLGLQESQFSRQLDWRSRESALDRQLQQYLQQNQLSWQSWENYMDRTWRSQESERQRQWESQEAERQRQWATSERISQQEWEAEQRKLDREFETLLREREWAWRSNEAQLERDLQRWIIQKQFEHGWTMAQAEYNYQLALEETRQRFQAQQRELDRALERELTQNARSSSGASTWFLGAMPEYVDLLKTHDLNYVKDRLTRDVNEANAYGAGITQDELFYMYRILEYADSLKK